MPFAAVVGDANVLLSAAIGKAALRVFTEYELTVHVTEANIGEVEKYLPRLISKYDLPETAVMLQWQVLPKIIHPREAYKMRFAEACSRLVDRDPDDAHPLALALTLELPLWSNDRDLHNQGVECYSTARLLSLLDASTVG